MSLEKLGIILHAEVKRSGRRTYLNLPDTEVKSCCIEPGDTLLIRLVEVEHVSEKSSSHSSSKLCKKEGRRL